MTLEEWLVENPDKKVPKVLELRAKLLPEKDEFCKKCVAGEEMLCGGYRDFFNQAESELYGVPQIRLGPCEKLARKMQVEQVETAGKGSLVPYKFLESAKARDLTYTESSWLLDGKELFPIYLRVALEKEVVDEVYMFLATAIKSGMTALNFPCSIFYTQRKFNIFERLVDYDMVYFNGLDTLPAGRFADMVFATVIERYNSGKPTFVSMQKDVTLESGRLVTEIVRGWNEF